MELGKVRVSPHIHTSLSIPRLMYGVILSLLPALFWGIYYFRIRALYLLIACVAGTVLTEYIFCILRKKEITLGDGSAILTGILLAMVLPPYLPYWMGFLGGVVAVSLGKEVFGGLGYNIFNPALVGRAFLMISFPIHMTTWKVPQGGNFFLYDTVTQATPLAQGLPKFGGVNTYTLKALVWGFHPGSMGEVSGVLLLVGGLFLIFARIADYRIPLGSLVTVVFLTGVFYLLGISPSPLFHLFSGGLLLGALFMATDPVTTPYTSRGRWIFGIGMGILVVSIRLWGGYPEGVMFSILIMNAFTPLINRLTLPSPLGMRR